MVAFGSASKSLTDNLLKPTARSPRRQTSLNTTISSMDDRRDAPQLQVDAIEKRYRAQFTALDALMGGCSRNRPTCRSSYRGFDRISPDHNQRQ